MKVVLASPHFPPNYKGGVELYTLRIAHGLRGRGHSVEVVCLESVTNSGQQPTAVSEFYEGLPVHRLHLDLRQVPDPFRRSYYNPDLGRWFKNFLVESRPDVLHINSGYLLGASVPLTASQLGIPTALTLHDYWFLCPLVTLLRSDGNVCGKPVEAQRCVWCLLSEKRRYRIPDQWAHGNLGDLFNVLGRSKTFMRVLGQNSRALAIQERRSLLKQALEKVDVVICPSRFVADKVVAYGLTPRKMAYMPFGLERVVPAPELRIDEGAKLRVGYLGNIIPLKGIHVLLTAFKKLQPNTGECELVVYGDMARSAAYSKQLLRIADGHPLITFAGPYANSDVGRVLDTIDVVVSSSICFENRPTVILEAFSHNTPVIASNLGGMAELVRDGHNGLLFEPGDADSLARQLRRLLDEPELLPALRRGIAPVRSVADELDDLESIYQNIKAVRADW
jgi:glycosyltransferase involved in cell wall biosynthesis